MAYQNAVKDAQGFWWKDGEIVPLAGGKGGGSSQTTVSLPAPTADQTALTRDQLQTSRRQGQAFTQQAAMNDPAGALAYLKAIDAGGAPNPNSIFGGLESAPGQFDPGGLREQLQAGVANQKLNTDLQTSAYKQLQRQLTGVVNLSPGEQKLLDDAYASAQTQGEQNLSRFMGEQANMRGLNKSDSPISADTALQAQNLNLGLQSAKAQSALNLAGTQANFNQGVAQFTSGLQQQGNYNRQMLASYQNPTATNTLNALAQQRMAQPSTQTNYQIPGWQGFAQTFQAIGQGIGGMAAGWKAASGG